MLLSLWLPLENLVATEKVLNFVVVWLNPVYTALGEKWWSSLVCWQYFQGPGAAVCHSPTLPRSRKHQWNRNVLLECEKHCMEVVHQFARCAFDSDASFKNSWWQRNERSSRLRVRCWIESEIDDHKITPLRRKEWTTLALAVNFAIWDVYRADLTKHGMQTLVN